MIIIEKQYVTEAIRIMTTYRSVMDDLVPIENTLKENTKILLSLQKDLDDIKDARVPEQEKAKKVHKVIADYEIELVKLQNTAMPYLKKMETLKHDSHVLYGILKEKFPGASDEQLQKALTEHIEKHDLTGEIKKES